MAKKAKTAFLSEGLSHNRKLEILGILIIAIAVLLALSIATYHTGDYEFARSVSPSSVFSTKSGLARHIHNGLGVLGAYCAYFFVHILFGYMSFIIPLLLIGYGWVVFREKNLQKMLWPTVYGLWCMILFSSFLGWISVKSSGFSAVWGGGTGLGIAVVLINILSIGAIILLCFLLIATFMAILSGDVQLKVDLVKDQMNDLQGKWQDWAGKRKNKKRKEARQREIKKQQAAERRVKSKQEGRSEKARRKREESEKQETSSKPETIDDIVARSQHEDLERREQQRRESQGLDDRQRAVINRNNSDKAAGGDDDVDISVFVGEGDEEADANELERQNRSRAQQIPEIKYKFPTVDLLDNPPEEGNDVDLEEIKNNKRIILDKLKRHNIEILRINAIVGPTVTLYELEPAPDVKISKIKSYAGDLKMATAAHGLRIIAPIPGRSAVGIEVPNRSRETVFIKTVINTKKYVESDAVLPLALGKTIENEVFLVDLAQMPHILIAGATGAGKTVGINTIITSLLYKCNPDHLKFVMIDPKKIELSLYRNIQNHFLATLPGAEEPIVTDTTKALETLESLTLEMDERYDLMKMAMVRHIKDYNKKQKAGELDEDLGHRRLPYIVVIIDELADLMMTAGKTIEEPIARLAQLARAVGIHLVLATQRPSVNVITGTIKANFPARMAYQVASKVDSRTILDMGGADQLIGRGDVLFTNGGGMTRIQNAFVSTAEVERITAFIGEQRGYDHSFFLPVEEEEGADIPNPLDDIDEYFAAAAKLVVLHQQGSVSLLQRKLKIGYNRAGRIIDQLYQAGVVGAYQGSTARDVLVEDETGLEELLESVETNGH
jgi:S-DNA-T family DNA segregation ATPase FtsK/SpoIIIE